MITNNRNNIIRGGIILCDFIVLNSLLALFCSFGSYLLPTGLLQDLRLFYFVSNVALAISEGFFSSIIYLRIVSFRQICQRTGELALGQVCLFYLSLHFLSTSSHLFNHAITFFLCFYFCLILSRICERIFLKWFRQKGGNVNTVIFVGSDRSILDVYKELISNTSTGYKALGYYADKEIKKAPNELKWLGTLTDLDERLASGNSLFHPNTCFCSLSHEEADRVIRIIKYCDEQVIHFYYIPRKFGDFHLHLQAEQIGTINAFTNRSLPLLDPTNKALKRGFDIVFSSVVCLCLLPLLPIIAICIKCQSKGPIFFKQKRTGLNGRDFYCYKFRSMHQNAHADTQQATKKDPRKFPFGNFMRKTNIDELPQFINVLKGDMSIVGPRPHMLYHTEMYSHIINKYMVRHFSKPGITGWAQVTGFRGETKELWQMEERIHRDIWYIENWSFLLDLKIIAMTAIGFIKPDKNAY